MNETKPDVDPPAGARDGLAQAEAGDAGGIARIEKARETSPADVEAVEQEASEGPAGRGLAR